MDDNLKDDLLSKYKIPLALCLVGGVLMIGGLLSSGLLQKTFIKSQTSSTPTSQINYTPKVIKVDVSGAVKTPGVYSLDMDARVEDAIKASGGLTEEVDSEYLSKSIVLSQKLTDGSKVYVPKQGDRVQGTVNSNIAGVTSNSGGPVNVNQAGISELEDLPGIGPVTAQKIIDNRPYSEIGDLLTKKAVTKATFEKIKDKVSI